MGDARETRIREAHRAMAEALGPVDGRSAVELARHWAAAEQALEFSACVRDAVAEAHRSEEYAAEAELLEQLLAWWSAPGVAEAIGEPRTAIVLAAARAHRLAGQPHACVDRCRDLVTESHPAAVAVAAQVELAAALTETADATAAAEVARALALVGSLPDTPDAAHCVAFAAGLALSYPTPHGLAVAQDAARRAQAHGLKDVAARASNTLACLLAWIDPQAALAALETSGRLAEELVEVDPTLLVRHHINAAYVHTVAGRYAEAAAEGLIGLTFAATRGLAATSGAHLAATASEALIAQGELGRARGLVDAWRRRPCDGRERAWLAALGLRLDLLTGGDVALEALADGDLRELPAAAAVAVATARVEAAVLLGTAGGLGLADWDHLLQLSPPAVLPLLALVEADPRPRDTVLLDQVWARLPDLHPTVAAPWAAIRVAARGSGSSVDQIAAWDEAVRLTETGVPAVLRILVLLGAAEAHLRTGDALRARLLAQVAADRVSQTGAEVFARRVKRVGIATARAVPPEAKLTPRELETLRLLVRGASNAEIARTMSVSVRTVEVHVSNVLRKLGAPSRGAAVASALHGGLLDEGTVARHHQ